MAILQGFPPSNTISPSVRITEQDLSFIAPNQSFHRAGLVGFASKGPVNLPTLIATTRQLATIFGNPHPDVGDPFLIYAAQQYLLVANELYVVRVANIDPVSDEQALSATVDVPAAGNLITVESSTAGPYTFAVDSFFRWKLNGQASSQMLLVPAGTYATADLVNELNAQIDSENDGIQFYANATNKISVTTVWAYGPSSSLEFISVSNSIYGNTVLNGNPTGLGTGMTPASVLGTSSMYPNVAYQTPGHYDFTGLTGLEILIVVDGTDNVLIDGVVQTIDLSAMQGQVNNITTMITAINAELAANGGTLPGGWVAVKVGNALQFKTAHTGVGARLRIKPNATAALFGLATNTVSGTTPSGVSGAMGQASYGLITGAANNAGTTTFSINAESPGIDGNGTQVVVTNNIYNNTFTLQVYNNGVSVENWGNLTKDPTSSLYVEQFISTASDYIRVVDNTADGAGPTEGTYNLAGGTDGIPADPDDQDTLLIGSAVGYTGLYTMSEPEQINIDLIAVPGHSSTTVVQATLDLCQNVRGDCLAIIDPPFGFTVQEIIAWQNGTHPLNQVQFNSDFGALYWPWVQITDTFNQVQVWVPPSGSVMATIARSDFLGNPWSAPAGMTRGIVPGINNIFSRATQPERDLMYSNSNCINPIVQFSDVEGYLLWGQKTLQRTPTALDRINVRRLMFFIEKSIRVASRSLLFEPNDTTFQSNFVKICTSILANVQTNRGLYDFIIVADGTLNTPDVVDRNEFHAQIGVQPTKSVEFMFIEFAINRTGDFSLPATTSF